MYVSVPPPFLSGNDSSSPHDPFYPPIISLPEVPVDSGEGDEDVVFVMRAKLFRYSSSSSPPEWKERGTGDVKLLRHRETGGWATSIGVYK